MAEAVLRRRDDFAWRSLISRCEIRQSRKAPTLDVIQVSVPDVVAPLLQRRDYWATVLAQPRVAQAVRPFVNEADALLLSNPMAYPLLQLVSAKTVVAFDAIDDWLNHPQMTDRRGFIAKGYEMILRRADVVVTNAKEMRDRLFERGAAEVVVVPNGIKAAWLLLPEWSSPTGQIRLGYAGKLAKRIDVDLLAALARHHGDWRIELVGPVLDSAWVAPLKELPNVVFLGETSHDALPALFRQWHVALIPHNVGALENGGHPIKLYEYLALGVPVVSTGIAELEDVSHVIDIADSHEEFEAAVVAAIDDPQHTVSTAQRRDAVRRYTWRNSASQLVDLLQEASRS